MSRQPPFLTPMDLAAQPVRVADDPSALTRADVAWLAAAYRRDARHWPLAAFVLTALAGLAGAALLRAGSLAWEWTGAEAVAGQAVGWLAALGGMAAAVRRDRRLRARHELACPECAQAVAPPGLGVVLTTGRCPACGAEILARDG